MQITMYFQTPGKTDQNRKQNNNSLEPINFLIEYWRKKNCHNSRRSLLQQPFIRIVTKIFRCIQVRSKDLQVKTQLVLRIYLLFKVTR